MTDPASKVREADESLSRAFGSPAWRPSGRPVEGLVRTILSQNTNDVNSGRAFDSLMRRFKTLDAVRRASEASIEKAIRVGGLARIKSGRIKKILNGIAEKQGRLSLDYIAKMPVESALAELESLDGVGPKTSRCVLLFDLGRPAFPVDTHILRISTRLGLVPRNASLGRAHAILGPLVPLRSVYRFHVNLIRFGRTVCKARDPKCNGCPLFDLCEYEGKWERAEVREGSSSASRRS